MKTRTCSCAICGLIWESERPIDELISEADDLFSGLDVNNPDEMAQVCEPCFIEMMDATGRTDFYKYIDKSQLN